MYKRQDAVGVGSVGVETAGSGVAAVTGLLEALRPRAARARSDRAFLQLAALAFGQPAPYTEPFVIGQRVLQALDAHLAAHADPLGLARGPTLLREERLRIGLDVYKRQG